MRNVVIFCAGKLASTSFFRRELYLQKRGLELFFLSNTLFQVNDEVEISLILIRKK